MRVDYLDHLPDEFKTCAVRLLLNALKDKLVPILGNDGRAQDVLEESLSQHTALRLFAIINLLASWLLRTAKAVF